MNKIKIRIDQKEFSGNAGDTILKVAQENRISIPTLCHNDKISPTTSCFVCVVKDVKTGRFLPSCSATITEGMEIESDSTEVFEMRQAALNLLLSEHGGDCEAPCTIACPAHAQVEEYVRAGKNGMTLEALKIIKKRIPLPMSIGRVCPRFCEKDCRRNVIDPGQPVAINEFKRTSADIHFENYLEELPELSAPKVAIIGAGPAGYAAAYYLRLDGIGSEIFERLEKPGGMLRYGIPEYRLPKAIVDKEYAHLEKMGGITMHYNQELGKNLQLDQLKKKYDAVILTIGSWKPGPMYAEGEDLALGGIHWLEMIARNGWTGENPGKTIVVGGGNTAMDCVRTAVRLGSNEVWCYYRRTEKEMPAEAIEIQEAKEEGVQFKFLSAPVKVEKKGHRLAITFQEMKLGEPDASGRRRPVPIEGSEYTVEADTIIAAIGQQTIPPEGAKVNRWKDIDANRKNYHMEDNVFAAGDCVTGPATVVEAVAAGRIAALGVKAYLEGNEYQEPYTINVTRGLWQSLKKEDLVYLTAPVERTREALEFISLYDRKTSFKEVTLSFTVDQLKKEGERCLECSCTDKSTCKLKKHAETYLASPDGILGVKESYNADTRHPAILLDRNKCIKCGTCVKICKEVVNKSLLGFGNRGFETNIITAFGESLPDSCADCGECIENCPTGALGWKIKS
ncbi:MAG: FAD-dependent oxidoreductase [Candidatus Marinimicrobia bacterium]|nr:FAD-dependent oxidoreductase [Candidatus Neomarinimicrobiota bacterium]